MDSSKNPFYDCVTDADIAAVLSRFVLEDQIENLNNIEVHPMNDYCMVINARQEHFFMVQTTLFDEKLLAEQGFVWRANSIYVPRSFIPNYLAHAEKIQKKVEELQSGNFVEEVYRNLQTREAELEEMQSHLAQISHALEYGMQERNSDIEKNTKKEMDEEHENTKKNQK